jgi:hypothetical protein
MSAAAYAGLMLWNEQREEWVGNKPRQQSQGSRESVFRLTLLHSCCLWDASLLQSSIAPVG